MHLGVNNDVDNEREQHGEPCRRPAIDITLVNSNNNNQGMFQTKRIALAILMATYQIVASDTICRTCPLIMTVRRSLQPIDGRHAFEQSLRVSANLAAIKRGLVALDGWLVSYHRGMDELVIMLSATFQNLLKAFYLKFQLFWRFKQGWVELSFHECGTRFKMRNSF